MSDYIDLSKKENDIKLYVVPNGDGTFSFTTGANSISKDGGPSQTVTRTYTASADGSTAFNITAAPTSGQKIVAMDILISVDTACFATVQMETSGNVLAGRYLPANGSDTITPRGFIKGDLADKKLQVKTSVASKVAVTCIYFSEA